MRRRTTHNASGKPPENTTGAEKDLLEQLPGPQAGLEAHNTQPKDAGTGPGSCVCEEDRYQTIFQNSLDAILLIDPRGAGTVIAANNEACRMLGWSEAEMKGLTRKDIFNMRDPRTVQLVLERKRTGKARGEASLMRRDGALFPAEVSASRFADVSGRTLSVVSIRDITERKQIEEKLRESEGKYRMLVERAKDGIIIVQDGLVKYANPRMAQLNGSSLDLLVGSPITDHIASSDLEKVTTAYRRRIAGESVPTAYEALLKRRSGAPAPAELSAGVVIFEGRPAVLAVIRDITERKRADEELRKARDELEQRVRERTAELREQARLVQEERDRLKTLIDSMWDGVWLTDEQGNVIFVNAVAKEQMMEEGIDPERAYEPHAAVRLLSEIEVFTLGGERLGAGTLQSIFEGASYRGVEIVVANRNTGEKFYRRLSFSPVMSKGGRVTGAVVLVQDITHEKRAEEERTRLEEELQQAQKLEAIGTLAGGIAHDFNNMLAVIMGNAEMALDDLVHHQEPVRNIKQIISASKRARDLVRQILMFSRRAEQGKRPFRLIPLVKETFKLLRGTLPSTIRMKLDIQTGSDTVNADPSRLQQVLMNLATNAAYAMRTNGGLLTLALSEASIREDGKKPYPELAPGSYLKLTVTDTGPGMTEEVRSRVFEPFFTTKAPGQGTGMGLAVVYGIVKDHRGTITLESAPGKGSTFSIFLPLTETEVKQEDKGTRTAPKGKERILLVDDEPQIVNTISTMLRRLGYNVATAGSGPEALDRFRRDPNGFDVVITDQTMPDITGLALTRKILEVRKDIPVILFTGYSELVSPEKAKEAGVRAFLMKPLIRAEMAEAIRKVL